MKKSLIVILIAALAIVVFTPPHQVNAIEKGNIETVDCDLNNIDGVNFEITSIFLPFNVLEVGISPDDCLLGVYNLEESKDYSITNYSYYALYNNKRLQIVDGWYCSSNYLTRHIDFVNYNSTTEKNELVRWYGTNYYLYSLDLNNADHSTNYAKLETNYTNNLVFYKLYEEVGISAGVTLDLLV